MRLTAIIGYLSFFICLNTANSEPIKAKKTVTVVYCSDLQKLEAMKTISPSVKLWMGIQCEKCTQDSNDVTIKNNGTEVRTQNAECGVVNGLIKAVKLRTNS